MAQTEQQDLDKAKQALIDAVRKPRVEKPVADNTVEELVVTAGGRKEVKPIDMTKTYEAKFANKYDFSNTAFDASTAKGNPDSPHFATVDVEDLKSGDMRMIGMKLLRSAVQNNAQGTAYDPRTDHHFEDAPGISSALSRMPHKDVSVKGITIRKRF